MLHGSQPEAGRGHLRGDGGLWALISVSVGSSEDHIDKNSFRAECTSQVTEWRGFKNLGT